MPKTHVYMSNVGGLKLPRDKNDRARRPIEGLPGYQVNQAGQIWLDEYRYLETEWTGDYFFGELEDQVVKIHTREAAALAWLTADQRAEIRSALPTPIRNDEGHKEIISDLIARFSVSKYVLFHLSQTTEGQIAPWVVDETDEGEGEVHIIKNMVVQDYSARLIEAYRPPSKGGNTSALHLHSFRIGNDHFYFTGRGTKKWIFKDDRASFTYKIGPKGGKAVQRTSLRTLDAKGNVVKRGDRRYKTTLRTAETRLPASRRECRD